MDTYASKEGSGEAALRQACRAVGVPHVDYVVSASRLPGARRLWDASEPGKMARPTARMRSAFDLRLSIQIVNPSKKFHRSS
mmetsp:Transcript_2328/g.7883  ORF Transcript_2328/g.7883 Transcript_2328/m.7883 type:complete len:82 (+) Transcript_2328:152-397(+)